MAKYYFKRYALRLTNSYPYDRSLRNQLDDDDYSRIPYVTPDAAIYGNSVMDSGNRAKGVGARTDVRDAFNMGVHGWVKKASATNVIDISRPQDDSETLEAYRDRVILSDRTSNGATVTCYGMIVPTRPFELIVFTVAAWHNSYTLNQVMRLNNPEKPLSTSYYCGEYYYNPSYARGDYVDEVIADEDAYPADGAGGDYWYVRDRIAIVMKARVNGAWVDTVPRVKVDGVWKEAAVHPRVNGVWVG